MQPFKKIWALNAAFLFYMIFAYSMQSFLGIFADPEKMKQVYLASIAGNLLGIFLLPLIIPLGALREGAFHRNGRPARHKLRLAVLALFFIPGVVLRFLGVHAWQESLLITVVMSCGTGAGTVLIYGLFYTLGGKNRALWSVLYTSAGLLVFYLILGPGRTVLTPHLFMGSGYALAAAGIMIILFLSDALQSRAVQAAPVKSNAKQSTLPLFLFPILAALVILWTNSFTDRLFMPIMNNPFNSGFNPSTVAMLLMLAALGFLANYMQQRFMSVFIPLCSVLFVLSPSLLLFSRSESVFLILYTLNVTALHLIPALFPLVIMDLYWNRNGSSGFWAWLLAFSIQLIRSNSIIQAGLFRNITIDNAYAVILLSLAAIVFFVLCYKSIAAKTEKLIPAMPATDIIKIFKKYNLSEREAEVAALLVREGLSNEEAGQRLFISPLTVKSHISQIYQKFGVKRRAAFLAKVYSESN